MIAYSNSLKAISDELIRLIFSSKDPTFRFWAFLFLFLSIIAIEELSQVLDVIFIYQCFLVVILCLENYFFGLTVAHLVVFGVIDFVNLFLLEPFEFSIIAVLLFTYIEMIDRSQDVCF